MTRKLVLVGIASLVICSGEQLLLAQGKGHGSNRSLSALSRAGSNGATSQSMQGMTRAKDSMKLGGTGMNRAAAGMNRAVGAGIRSSDLKLPRDERVLANQQRILDHRLNQAEHLRAISEANGNERLLTTADRMESKAHENATRQMGRFQEPPTTPTTPDTVVSDATPIESGATDAGATNELTTLAAPVQNKVHVPKERAGSAKRGFWIKSR